MTPENSCIYVGPSMLELFEIVKETSKETETLHICEVVDNHVRFRDSEVDMTPDELSELLPIIQSISHRNFEITIRDEDVENGERFPLTNLTINFK